MDDLETVNDIGLHDFVAQVAEAVQRSALVSYRSLRYQSGGQLHLLAVIEKPLCHWCHRELVLDPGSPRVCATPECAVPSYTATEVYQMVCSGRVLDARGGGLVLSRDDDVDNLLMIGATVPGIFQAMGFMHGGEFILSAAAAEIHAARLKEIGEYREEPRPALGEIPISASTRVLNTRGRDCDLILLCDGGQSVINKAATTRFYEELERLNASVGWADKESLGPEMRIRLQGSDPRAYSFA